MKNARNQSSDVENQGGNLGIVVQMTLGSNGNDLNSKSGEKSK